MIPWFGWCHGLGVQFGGVGGGCLGASVMSASAMACVAVVRGMGTCIPGMVRLRVLASIVGALEPVQSVMVGVWYAHLWS